MASNADENGKTSDETILRIDDPDQLSQNKRINELLSRREDVIDARNQALELYLTGELRKEQALMLYQAQIESLIIDLWTKFTKTNSERGKELLHDEAIATVSVSPPAELLGEQHDMAAGEEMPEPKTVTIHGLKWFIENDPIVHRQFSTHKWNPPGKKVATGKTILDFGILDEALLKIMEFIHEAGIDADLEDDTEDAEFDYSDLLDEDGSDPE